MELQKAIPDIRYDVQWIYVAGENLVVQFTLTGTLPVSIRWELPVYTIFTFESGKIVRDVTHYDLENQKFYAICKMYLILQAS